VTEGTSAVKARVEAQLEAVMEMPKQMAAYERQLEKARRESGGLDKSAIRGWEEAMGAELRRIMKARAAAYALLQSLDNEVRAVFVGRYLNGLTWEAIAEAHAMSLATVYRVRARGLLRLAAQG